MKNQNVKKCPFCGSKAILGGGKENGNKLSHWIFCDSCLSESDSYDTRIESINAWNRRAK